MRLQIYLLGAPRIEQGGEPVQIQRRKAIALLAYLAVAGQFHSRDALATMFWPEFDQSGARANLRRVLFQLRSEVGEQALLVEGDQVGISPQAVELLDVKAFQERVEKTRLHGHSLQAAGALPVCADCQVALAEAVAIYQGDFMAGFSLPDSPVYDEWQFFQAESLRRMLAEALQQLVQWHSDWGEYEAAIEHARRWLALDTLHETAHRLLMRLYAWSGQQAAAVRQYRECARLMEEELGVEPDEETVDLYEAIRSKQLERPALERPAFLISANGAEPARSPAQLSPTSAPRPLREAPHNLPLGPTPFVGRQPELAELTGLLNEEGCQLLTLVGPGGIGKTRLAVEAARSMVQNGDGTFKDGVWFVPLATIAAGADAPGSCDLDSVAEIVAAIAKVLDFAVYADREQLRRQLLDSLRSRRLLLILDNFEHLLCRESMQLVSDILESAPQSKLLVTSRVRLNAHAEQLYPVAGLRTPAAGYLLSAAAKQEIASFSSMQLFQECARRIKPDFQLENGNISDVTRICQLVDGMPLGIELAASWMEVLSPPEIAAEIERSLDFLEGEWYDLPERQRSLRAVFESSFRLLTDRESASLEALTVFHGSFSREAAESVAGASLKTLLTLVNKSWLQRDASGRYQIHELLRQYAAERLQSNPDAWQQAREKHASYFARFLEEQDEAMKGARQREAFDVVALEIENIRRAMNWLVANNRLGTMVAALPPFYRYCESRARTFDLLDLVNAGLNALEAGGESDQHPDWLAILLTAKSAFFFNGYPIRYENFGWRNTSDTDALNRAWVLAARPGVVESMGFWSVVLGYTYGRVIQPREGVEYLRQLADTFLREDRPWERALALYFHGCLLLVILQSETENRHLLVETEGVTRAALALFEQEGDLREQGCALRMLGNNCDQGLNLPEAIEYWKAAQEKLGAAGEWAIAAEINWQLGDAHLKQGDFENAFLFFHIVTQTYLERGHKQNAAYGYSKESFEALRYSSIEYAREARLRSLALSEDIGDMLGIEWSKWEMGEVCRVAGDLDGARLWYEKAAPNFKKYPQEHSFYHRGYGDIAQMTGNYPEAERRFRESIRISQETGDCWAEAYAWGGLGRALLGLRQAPAALDAFTRALEIARRIRERSLMLVALSGFAGVHAWAGNSERAVELGALVQSHYASWRETKSQVAEHLEKASGDLTPQQTASARERGQRFDLFETVAQILES